MKCSKCGAPMYIGKFANTCYCKKCGHEQPRERKPELTLEQAKRIVIDGVRERERRESAPVAESWDNWQKELFKGV